MSNDPIFGSLLGSLLGGPNINSGNTHCNQLGRLEQINAYHQSAQAFAAMQRRVIAGAKPRATGEPEPPAPGHRTQEEIIAQCEARYAELERQVAERARLAAIPKCKDCRWARERKREGFMKCYQPLVFGLQSDRYSYAYDTDSVGRYNARLCGPEKALWEPRLTLWEKIVEFFCK